MLALDVGGEFNWLGGCIWCFKGRWIDDDDLYFHLPVVSFDAAINACEMVSRVPVYYFTVVCGVKRVACGEHCYGFEQVGFALSIFSIEKKESWP